MTRLLKRFENVKAGTKFLDIDGNDYYFEYVTENGAVFVDAENGWLIEIKSPYVNYKSRLEFYKYDILKTFE